MRGVRRARRERRRRVRGRRVERGRRRIRCVAVCSDADHAVHRADHRLEHVRPRAVGWRPAPVRVGRCRHARVERRLHDRRRGAALRALRDREVDTRAGADDVDDRPRGDRDGHVDVDRHDAVGSSADAGQRTSAVRRCSGRPRASGRSLDSTSVSRPTSATSLACGPTSRATARRTPCGSGRRATERPMPDRRRASRDRRDRHERRRPRRRAGDGAVPALHRLQRVRGGRLQRGRGERTRDPPARGIDASIRHLRGGLAGSGRDGGLHPAHISSGSEQFPEGDPLTFLAGGDEGFSGAVKCDGFPDHPVLIVWASSHNVDGGARIAARRGDDQTDDAARWLVRRGGCAAPAAGGRRIHRCSTGRARPVASTGTRSSDTRLSP